MKKMYEDVFGVGPMVDTVLTTEDVLNLYGEYAKNRKYYNQNVEYPTVTGFINNVIYHNWDGVDHDGVIVVVKDGEHAEPSYYFMERTWKVDDDWAPSAYVAATPIWHALMPVKPERSKEVSKLKTKRHMIRLETEGFSTKELAELIIDKCIVDDMTIPEPEFTSFCENDITETRYFESEERKRKYNEWKDDAVKKLMNGDVPAGDELWDELCVGQLASERVKIFEALWKNGHHAYLDGERDSFGWVTCGIIMDGQLMTSMYF